MINYENILINSNKNSYENIIQTEFVEENFFLSTLKFVNECNNEYREASKEFYKSILESAEDTEIINESFSDFFKKISEIIKKFIAFIKKMFDRFIISLNKLIRSDKYVLKNIDKLRDFSIKHEFDFEGFNYTFSSNVPAINALAEFDNDFMGLNIEEIKNKNPKEMKSYIQNALGQLNASLNGNYYDVFRAEVLGQINKSITQSEFVEELFMVYRNGYNSKEIITADPQYISNAVLFFKNYKSIQSQTEKEKNNLEKDYKNIEKRMHNVIYRNMDNDAGKLLSMGVNINDAEATFNITPDTMTVIDNYIKSKCNQVLQMSNIHSMAYAQKLDALIEKYKQDKAVLYRALGQIIKKGDE